MAKRRTIHKNKRNRIIAKSGNICAICGRPILNNECTIDHIVPITRGGTYDDNNLQVAHKDCNLMKANLKEKKFYSLVNDVAENRMINNYNYKDMLTMARAIVRGTINNIEVHKE